MEEVLGGYAWRGKILPDVILRRTDLTMGAKVLFAVLRDSCGRKDHCWPSQAYLAASLRQTVRSIQNHLKRLVELGLVVIKKRPWRGNIYYIPSQNVASTSPVKASAAAAVSSMSTAPATSSPIPSAKAPARPSSSSAPYSRQQADASFERLWAAYPRSEARKPALRHWHRLTRAGSAPVVEFLLDRIKDNVERNPRWKRGFAPFLATWLKDRRWEDPLPDVGQAPDVPEREKEVVRQKEERPEPKPIQMPEAASTRLREALALWPCNLSDAEAAMVRVVWNLLYSVNRLPTPKTIAEAMKTARTSFPAWLSNFYRRG
jgi:hypothetical protein